MCHGICHVTKYVNLFSIIVYEQANSCEDLFAFNFYDLRHLIKFGHSGMLATNIILKVS